MLEAETLQRAPHQEAADSREAEVTESLQGLKDNFYLTVTHQAECGGSSGCDPTTITLCRPPTHKPSVVVGVSNSTSRGNSGRHSHLKMKYYIGSWDEALSMPVPCTNRRTRVQIPSTHYKLGMAAYAGNSSTSMGHGRAGAGGSLGFHGQSSQ